MPASANNPAQYARQSKAASARDQEGRYQVEISEIKLVE